MSESSARAELLRALRSELPADAYSTDPNDLVAYGRDWTRRYTPDPLVIVRPRSTRHVSTILELCSRHVVPVVPSGGRTGLSGGAVAASGEVVLSLERMNDLGPVDTTGATVEVGAGAVTEAVHEHAARVGLTWPVDFASKGSSQIGGNIATNAGGVRVIRYGSTRQWVLGLEVVLASGAVHRLGGRLEKDNSGLDLKQLFIGSEGILGVITRATLKLVRPPTDVHTLLFGLDDMPAVLVLFRAARRSPLSVLAFEMFDRACLDRVMQHRGLGDPLSGASAFYALLEVEATSEALRDEWLRSVIADGVVTDGTVARNTAQQKHIWAYREGISESLSATGVPHKQDVSVPIAELPAFVDALGQALSERYPAFDRCLFGHIGDGNVHVNLMKPPNLSDEAFFAEAEAADRCLFEVVRAHGGSISAEHGIGLTKKPYLEATRPADQIDLMRAVKRALDPQGILNPGKIF